MSIVVSNGQILKVSYSWSSSGGQSSGSGSELVVNGGAIISALPGVFAVDGVTVNGGGALAVNSGGSAADVLVSGTISNPYDYLTASMTIGVGGAAWNVTVDGYRSTSGFSANYADRLAIQGALSGLVLNDGQAIVDVSGTVAQAEVLSGGYLTVYGAASGVMVSTGGLDVESTGSASGVVISSGAREVAYTGAKFSGDEVLSGAYLTLMRDGAKVADNGDPTAKLGIDAQSGVVLNLSYTNGASLSNFMVGSGDHLSVETSAVAYNVDVAASGGVVVSSGGLALDLTVASGGFLNLGSQGVLSNGRIDSGGTALVGYGTVISGGVVESGGTLTYLLMSRGSAVAGSSSTIIDGVTLLSGAVVSSLFIASGASITGWSPGLSATMTVAPNALAVGGVFNGAQELVQGVASGAVLIGKAPQTGWSQVVQGGGLTVGTIVSSGALQQVGMNGAAVGGVDSASVVLSSGMQYVVNGSALATDVQSGGVQKAVGAGVLSGAIVEAGGLQALDSGGTSIGAQVRSGGTVELLSATAYPGSSPVAPVVISGLVVSSGGLLEGSVAGAETLVAGGNVSLRDGAHVQLYVSSGGTASGFVVAPGQFGSGLLTGGLPVFGGSGYSPNSNFISVGAGGTAAATVVSGGTLTIGSGGTASGAVVSAGGVLVLAPGAAVHSAQVLSGGVADLQGLQISNVFTSNFTFSTVINNAPVLLDGLVVSSGGLLMGALTGSETLDGAGGITEQAGAHIQLLVSGGATAAHFVLNAGAVTSGPNLSSSTSQSGTGDYISLGSGGAASAIVLSGGVLTVGSGGSSVDAVVSSGGLLILSSGGSAFNTTVLSGGEVYLAAGAQLSGGALASGAILSGVLSGAGDNLGPQAGPSIADGADLQLSVIRSAAILSTRLGAGDAIVLGSGGSAEELVLSAGGQLQVSAGAVARDTVIASGGQESIVSGGLDLNPMVSSGGALLVSAGGQVSGLVIEGGHATFAAGNGSSGSSANSGGTVTFSGSGGVLTLQDARLFGQPVSGFAVGDAIDLPHMTVSGLQWVQSAGAAVQTLRVMLANGQGVLQLNFAGLQAGQMVMAQSDGQGGTELVLGPSSVDLAQMAIDAYAVGSSGPVDGFDYLTTDNLGGTNQYGFSAAVFQKNNTFVVAFRGTVPTPDQSDPHGLKSAIKTLLADSSWLTGAVTADLFNEVKAAANLIANIYLLHPTANIILAGHSLGGAIAQAIAAETGLPALALDAPRISTLLPQLVNNASLGNAFAALKGDAFASLGVDDNIRVYGDQISVVGTNGTNPVSGSDDWTITPNGWAAAVGSAPLELTFLASHDQKLIHDALQLNAPITPAITGPVSAAALYAGQYSGLTTAASFDAFVAGLSPKAWLIARPAVQAFSLVVGVAAVAYNAAVDPGPATTYGLVANAGSPLIASIDLPIFAGVDHYKVETLQGGAWSADQTITPLASVTFSDGVAGVAIEAFDAAGDLLTMPDGFTFDAGFTAVGTFSGTLYTELESLWNGGSGDFSWTSDWSAGLTPDSGTDVLIDAAGVYTVTASLTEYVLALDVDAPGATLAISAALDAAGDVVLSGGTIDLASGGTITAALADLEGGALVMSGGLLSAALNVGAAGVLSGFGALLSGAADSGLIEAQGGVLLLSGAVTGPGRVAVATGATLEVAAGGVLNAVAVSSGATLRVHAGAVISGAAILAGGAIDFVDAPFSSVSAMIDSAGSLDLVSGGRVVESVGLGAASTGLSPQVRSDGQGGMEVVFAAKGLGPISGSVLSSVYGDHIVYALFDASGTEVASQVTSSGGGVAVSQYMDGAGRMYAARIQNTTGAETESQDFNGDWAQKDATITLVLGGGSTLVESFDGAFNHTGAVLSRVLAGGTIVQDYDGSWNQTSAVITTDEGNGATVTQHFDGGWNQTSASIIYDTGSGAVITQDYDGQWSQRSATIATPLAGGASEVQYFNSSWVQTSATIVQHPAANVTETQSFDGGWTQLSADIVIVSGAQTIDQTFDGHWVLTGGTVSTALAANVDLVQSYDAAWNLLAGESRVMDYLSPGLESLMGAPGAPVTYVISPGTINGDAFSNFVTAAANPSAHDVLEFVGYGAGATVTRIDASHWQVATPGQGAEVFTLAATLDPAAGDVIFKG